VGVVLTTPPFPYSRQMVDEVVGLPVLIDPGLEARHIHYGEVGLDAAGQLVTSGLYGWTLVVTGLGDTVSAAKADAYRRAPGVTVPNLRYRTDIGERLLSGQLAQVRRLGWFDARVGD
jgi:phosphoribosylamine--glycine ligase